MRRPRWTRPCSALNLGDAAVLQAQVNVGEVIAATVLPPQGGTDLLSFLGQTVTAQIPPRVHPGETLLLQVTGFTNSAVIVKNLGTLDPNNPIPTVNVELPAPAPGAPQSAVLTTTIPPATTNASPPPSSPASQPAAAPLPTTSTPAAAAPPAPPVYVAPPARSARCCLRPSKRADRACRADRCAGCGADRRRGCERRERRRGAARAQPRKRTSSATAGTNRTASARVTAGCYSSDPRAHHPANVSEWPRRSCVPQRRPRLRSSCKQHNRALRMRRAHAYALACAITR